MAATKIADVIVPGATAGLFVDYVIQRTTELSELWTSGVVQAVPNLALPLNNGGTTIRMPFWNDLGGAEEILSDTVPLSVDKITAGVDVAVINARGKAWGANDLAGALAGADPMTAIGDLVAAWWARRQQTMLLSVLKGVFAAASMSGNKSDISGGGAGVPAAIIGAETTIDAVFKLGDAWGGLNAIIMHSAVLSKLMKDDLIDTEVPSAGGAAIRRYLGMRVIVDDSMPVSSGVYTSYIFGPGAVGYVEGGAPVPVETDRDSLQGDDILINRRHFVIHPRGVAWQGTAAGVSPTNAEFETGTNWIRAWLNKNIRIVQFVYRIV